MEELFVYALICGLGFDKYEKYIKTLDNLYEANITDEFLFDLEDRNLKDAVLHTCSIIDAYTFDHNKFGTSLMQELRDIYESTDIIIFSKKMYELWNNLPSAIDNSIEPFFTLCYADDCLSYGDEKQCRKLYEDMLNYYEKNNI